MKKPQNNSRVRYNLYLSIAQAEQLRRLFESGLTISGVARLSIRKCSNVLLEPDTPAPFPERFNFHLDLSDSEVLASIANRENCPKSVALRRLIQTYITINASALNQLF